MGFLSDTEIDFGDDQSIEATPTPPGSPRLAATHAHAIAQNITGDCPTLELDGRAVRDYAALCCEEFGLTDADKDDVLKTSQMHAHLISIRQYTRTMSLIRSVHRLLVESFLESSDFKDYMTRRVQATFLDAELPTYVRGCTARLIQHMQENPASWRIPPVVHANFINSKAFWKAISAVASNFRGDMRRKVKKSIQENLDVGALAKKLCVKGYQPTVDHWRRFALLRCYMRDWECLPVKRGKGRPIPFWSFIDAKLDKLRAKCAKPTEFESRKLVKEMLKANLKDDRKRYKGPTSGPIQLPTRIQLPDWQKDHAKAVKDMSKYVVDTALDDDADEDEGGDDVGNSSPDGLQDLEMEDRGFIDGGDDEDSTGPGSRNVQSDAASNQPPRANEQPAPIGRVLVPDTQEGSSSQAQSSELLINGSTSSNAGSNSQVGLPTPNNQSIGGSFVPETPRSPNSESQNRGTETQSEASASTPASGSTPSQDTQTGWAGGALVTRHGRPLASREGSAPMARKGQAPTLRTRRR